MWKTCGGGTQDLEQFGSNTFFFDFLFALLALRLVHSGV